MKLAELTQSNGKRVGLPPGGILMIVGFHEPPAEEPSAKTMIRWMTPGAQGAYHTFVKDPLKQVRNLLPVAYQGLGWTELTDISDNTVLIPAGSATGGYAELDEEGQFEITLDIPTGPVKFGIKATFDEVRELAGLTGKAPEALSDQPEGPQSPPPPAPSRPPTRRRK